MRTVILAGVAAGSLTGCGPGSDAPGPAPLAAADWKALPGDAKYRPETLERLKAGDPALQTPDGWDEFQKRVVRPARKRDFPAGKPE